jgi:hypothetical protein
MNKSISLELRFQSLKKSSYCVTSKITPTYNCVAWAAGETDRSWWPIPYPSAPYYWPESDKDELLADFISGFGTLGYVSCDIGNLEEGYEKIAIYTNEDGEISHMARQLNTGLWTSKCGDLEDIQHNLEDLEGEYGYGYGKVCHFMKRKKA